MITVNNINDTSGAGLIPIVIGVTGHRDLRDGDREQLAEKVRQIFVEIHKQCPHSPIVLLSPLAEGADRLAAKVALESPLQTAPDFRVQFIVPLPMAAEEYEKDFQTPESRAEFREVLQRADSHFSLPSVAGNTPENIGRPEHRDRQYEQVGAYIAHHSQILIALWDGDETEKVGGTSKIVQFKLKGIPEPYVRRRKHLDLVDSGPVYHVVTPRISNPNPRMEQFTVRKYYPETVSHEEAFEVTFSNILRKIDDYNRDIGSLSGSLAAEIKKNGAFAIPDEKTTSLPSSVQKLLHHYAVADTLALHFQRKSNLTLGGILVLVVLAVFCLQLYLEFFKNQYMLLSYPLLLGAAYWWYKKTKDGDVQNKHLDYRAIAEGLRVQIFWNMIALNENVSEHYLRKQRSEMDWIRFAIRSCSLPMCNSKKCEDEKNNDDIGYAYSLTEKHWVADQRNYFVKATERESAELTKRESHTQALYLSGLGIVMSMIVLHNVLHEFKFVHSVLIVSIGSLLAMAAAVQGYIEKRAFAEQEKQYARMRDMFAHASRHFSEAIQSKDFDKAREIVLDLGKEALAENGDWVLLHRAKPINVPKG
ncbi:MAG: hypothetical protein M0024_05535 [Nitrospiraceae bacterium]|nr:hypothetical protein [Nitrospiraceae bacterium]